MTNTVVLQTTVEQEFLAYLDESTCATKWANRKYEGTLKRSGQTIEVPVMPGKLNGTSNGTAGGTITAKDTTITSASLTVAQVEQDLRTIPDIEELRTKYDEHSEFINRMAYSLAQQKEGHILLTALQGCDSNNYSVTVPTTPTDGFAVVEGLRLILSRNRALMKAAGFITPKIVSLLRQNTTLLNGFKEGLSAREQGWVAGMDGFVAKISGIMLFETTNLPGYVTLTLPTIPVADDTFTFTLYNEETDADVSIVWTYTAAAGASAAGDIAIGANVAAAQANTVNAVNGTGTASAATYIDVSAANRALLKNYRMNMGAFASNVSKITCQFGENLSVGDNDITPADGVFSEVAVANLAWDKEAVNFVDQMTKLQVVPQSVIANQFADFLKYESVFQAAVLGRNGKRIANYLEQIS